jgi:hypothetical protein
VIPTGQATEIGAFRILYASRTVPYGDPDGQYSAIGLVKDGALSRPWFGNTKFPLPLLATGNVSADIMLEQALDKLHEAYVPPRNWIFYVFVGWCSVLAFSLAFSQTSRVSPKPLFPAAP